MKEQNKQKQIITEKGKTTKDYLVLKEQEFYSQRALDKQFYKFYKPKN
jgi:hypothetical protein